MKPMVLIQNLLFPPKCANCGELLDIELNKRVTSPLCPACRKHFEEEKSRECSICGLAMKFCSCMPKQMQKAQCTTLLKLIPYRANDESLTIRNFVYSVKHVNNRITFDFIAEQMREQLIAEMRSKSLMPQDCVITFLPRSKKNKLNDGFDQSYELARALSRITGIELVNCFERELFAKEQKNLNRFERRLNMSSAYKARNVRDKVRDKTLILVDDIVTTGSSMASCARIGSELGAYEVMGVCLGLTEKNNKK